MPLVVFVVLEACGPRLHTKAEGGTVTRQAEKESQRETAKCENTQGKLAVLLKHGCDQRESLDPGEKLLKNAEAFS